MVGSGPRSVLHSMQRTLGSCPDDKTRHCRRALLQFTEIKKSSARERQSARTLSIRRASVSKILEKEVIPARVCAHTSKIVPTPFSGNQNCCSEQNVLLEVFFLSHEGMNVPGWRTGLDLLSPVVEIHTGCPATFFGPGILPCVMGDPGCQGLQMCCKLSKR